ncbi:DUF4194 domain-containing protein [Phocaeicola salanitronis]|uniref:DUF4194 domain-containing protein n=1 Tax=Phocaeicola salanitronis TaxID=376805 RepID=UPI0025A330B3|nr:DUF4194 domain-containing protein [Phocaeicola salanitronis]MDM8305351.1 DUF4194 domain-containing protein [Phocaeicola salanitronis]
MNLESYISPYARAVVCLLKGPVDASDRCWNDILHYQSEIQKYLFQIGLELIVKRNEGFAYLKQMTDENGNTLGLIPRKPLGFECSVLVIILREVLEEFDSNLDELNATECYITGKELKERIELFLPERFNRVKLLNELDTYIARIVQLGFLIEKNQDNRTFYQIHRIIKEKVTLDQLVEFKKKLESYVESV